MSEERQQMMTPFLRSVIVTIVIIINNMNGTLFMCHSVCLWVDINQMLDQPFSQCPVLVRNATQVQLVAPYCLFQR